MLECVSNLLANEMFTEEGIRDEKETVDKILKDIGSLIEQTARWRDSSAIISLKMEKTMMMPWHLISRHWGVSIRHWQPWQMKS